MIEGLTLMLQSEQLFLLFYLTTQLFFRRYYLASKQSVYASHLLHAVDEHFARYDSSIEKIYFVAEFLHSKPLLLPPFHTTDELPDPPPVVMFDSVSKSVKKIVDSPRPQCLESIDRSAHIYTTI